MRIISGSRRGLRLKGPKGDQTRPTEDRIKESLFNILYNINGDHVILDLFGGSGSVGLEFLSRGAKKAYFIDKSNNSIACIRDNIAHTKFEDESVVIKNDFQRALKLLSKKKIKFDYIFIDPPYEKGLISKALDIIGEEDILESDGLVVVEHESGLELNAQGYIEIDKRNYGSKTLTFLKQDRR